MHVVIINGSPRPCQFSNTAKILRAFIKGYETEGDTYELYSLSSRKEWDAARQAYLAGEKIIFALPMYVESIPSLMLEFLESLSTERRLPAELSFILHGGFLTPAASKFTGSERYPWLIRVLSSLILKLIVNRKFEQFALD